MNQYNVNIWNKGNIEKNRQVCFSKMKLLKLEKTIEIKKINYCRELN